MGTMMIGDEWLLAMAEEGPEQRKTANILLTMQIRISRDYGHIVVLTDQYVRRRITQRAKWGTVPNLVVPCARCHCLARIAEWLWAAGLTVEQRMAFLSMPARARDKEVYNYLRQCAPELTALGELALAEASLGVK